MTWEGLLPLCQGNRSCPHLACAWQSWGLNVFGQHLGRACSSHAGYGYIRAHIREGPALPSVHCS